MQALTKSERKTGQNSEINLSIQYGNVSLYLGVPNQNQWLCNYPNQSCDHPFTQVIASLRLVGTLNNAGLLASIFFLKLYSSCIACSPFALDTALK